MEKGGAASDAGGGENCARSCERAGGGKGGVGIGVRRWEEKGKVHGTRAIGLFHPSPQSTAREREGGKKSGTSLAHRKTGPRRKEGANS